MPLRHDGGVSEARCRRTGVRRTVIHRSSSAWASQDGGPFSARQVKRTASSSSGRDLGPPQHEIHFSPTACHFLMRAHSPGDNNRTLEKGPSLNLFSFTRSTNARALNGNRGSIRTQSALSRCQRPIQHIHFYPVPTQGQPKPSER